MSPTDLKRYATQPVAVRRPWAVPLLAATVCVASFAAGYAVKPADQPSAVVRGIAAAPTISGAVRTATEFVRAIDYRVMLDAERRTAVIDRFAAAGARGNLEAQLTRGLDALRTSVSAGDVVSAPALLGYRARWIARNRASVSVWGVLLFGTALEPARSIWRTSNLDLVWVGNAWRVARHVADDGPSASWPISQLASTAALFRRYRDAP